MNERWTYFNLDGRQRGLTVLPSEIIDARRNGAKWHPDMRETFGPQCSHSSMMQIRESAEWREAVIDYARHHKLDENALQRRLCKPAKGAAPAPKPRNPKPRGAGGGPGSWVFDDGGRAAWKRSEDYNKVMRGGGDCATRAIQITLRDTESAVCYGKIRSDVIADKQRYYQTTYTRSGRNHHYDVHINTIRRLMCNYTNASWVYLDMRDYMHKAFMVVARRLASIESFMLLSRDHIAAVKHGVIHDEFNSRWFNAVQVLCNRKDAANVRRLLNNNVDNPAAPRVRAARITRINQ